MTFLVEGLFSILAREALKHNSFTSVGELTNTVENWTALEPRPVPVVWLKPSNTITSRTRRARTTLNRATKSAINH